MFDYRPIPFMVLPRWAHRFLSFTSAPHAAFRTGVSSTSFDSPFGPREPNETASDGCPDGCRSHIEPPRPVEDFARPLQFVFRTTRSR